METTACRLNGREAAQPALKTKTDGFSVFYTHPRTGLIRLVFQLVDQADEYACCLNRDHAQ